MNFSFINICRRLLENPSYYGLEDSSNYENVNLYLSELVDTTIKELAEAGTITIDSKKGVNGKDKELEFAIKPTSLGNIASYYYLKYTTVAHFNIALTSNTTIEFLVESLCRASEYNEMPVRHNEDIANKTIINSNLLRWSLTRFDCDDPHTKVNILLQIHFGRLQHILPSQDYLTDTKSGELVI